MKNVLKAETFHSLNFQFFLFAFIFQKVGNIRTMLNLSNIYKNVLMNTRKSLKIFSYNLS